MPGALKTLITEPTLTELAASAHSVAESVHFLAQCMRPGDSSLPGQLEVQTLEKLDWAIQIGAIAACRLFRRIDAAAELPMPKPPPASSANS